MNRYAFFLLWLRWVGANALAEMVGLGATFAIDALILAGALGMPAIFAAVDRAYPAYEVTGSIAVAVAIMALAFAITGAIVGAVHGLALVKLAQQPGRYDVG